MDKETKELIEQIRELLEINFSDETILKVCLDKEIEYLKQMKGGKKL